MVTHQRILTFNNGFNFRDLDGYKTLNSQVLKCNILVRSAHFSYLDRSKQREFYRYGTRAVIDFRSTSEVILYPGQLTSLTKYIRIPVPDNDITKSNVGIIEARKVFSKNPRAGFNQMLSVRRQFVTNEQAQEAFHQFIKKLCLHLTQGGILFHCSAGKDRTGLAAIYLLSLLGVPESIIYEGCILTNKTFIKGIKERLRFAVEADLGENYLHSIYDLSTANKCYYSQAISLINSKHGGIQNCLHDVLQTSNLMVEQLKYLYLEKQFELSEYLNKDGQKPNFTVKLLPISRYD